MERVIHEAMSRLARLFGGSAFCLETPLPRRSFWGGTRTVDVTDKALSIYSQILSQINQRYIIGYYRTNRSLDGKRRKVQIQVRNHPEYIIQLRSYY